MKTETAKNLIYDKYNINMADMVILDLQKMPKNACHYYQFEEKYYEYNWGSNEWSDVSNDYNWENIIKNKTMEQKLPFYISLFGAFVSYFK